MNKDILRSWLLLLRTPGIGPATLNPLLEQFGDPLALLEADRSRLPNKFTRHLQQANEDSIQRDLEWLEEDNNHLIPITSRYYPTLLKDIPDPPSALFVHGNPDVLTLPQLAIVGSRNPTTSGRLTAQQFAHFLATSGFTITSGLAVGVDAASHQGALQADGITIAVTGTGLDRVYPARHKALAHQIAEQGALLSEFPPGTPAMPQNFPRRNRIISGLSLGTLVVEAALKSGSLITARLALEQGREVFAIPGSIHNPLARGCHRLIRDGAKLVETAEDILEELAPLLGGMLPKLTTSPANVSSPPGGTSMDEEYLQLLESMGFDPISADSLIERSGRPPETISSMLLLLEMEGHVSSEPGGLFSRTGKPIT